MFGLENKKVLFITTKNIDYLRNVQEIALLKKNASEVDVIGSASKSYIKRLIKVYCSIIGKSFKKYDAVFVGFAPQLILPVFKWKVKKKTIVMDFFISVYDTMVFDRKKFKKNSFLGRFSKWIDTQCIKCADMIISDTKAHGNYFSEEFGVSREKITTLYLEADKKIYYQREAVKPDKLKEKFVVLYFGSILPLQGVEVINGAINLLKDDKQMFFYVVGPMKDDADKVKSENVEYIEWLSQEKLAEYISYSDLCLAGHFNKNINKAKRTIPGKAYIYEAMGKAMILGDNEANRELHTEDEKTFFVEMGSSKKLADKIMEVKSKLFG